MQAEQILAFRLARSGLATRDASDLADAAACPALGLRARRRLPITTDEFAAGAAAAGESADVVELLRYLFTEVLVEENSDVADGVRQALGRAPRDFADYARETASTGAWERRLAAAG